RGLEEAAERATRARAEAIDALAAEAFGTRLLASALSEAEERAERAVLEKTEMLASTLLSKDAAEKALARGARGRDELADQTDRRPQLAGSGSTWFVEGAFPDVGRVVTTVPASEWKRRGD
ncbi:MAG: hypothetical protein CL403_05105, partial [Acidimicrobiaceae bacterium]|nr:hypothetical protein [Acidimicrobiaceae bacterium]